MFIFGLRTLINHKERTKELGLSEIHEARKGPGRLHETSDKYIYVFLKDCTFISENYSYSRKLQSVKPFSKSQKITTSNSHSRKKNTRKRKGKSEKEKRGDERYSIRNRT